MKVRNLKNIFIIAAKYVLLVVLMAFLWMASLGAASAIVGFQQPPMPEQVANEVLIMIVLACAVNVGVVTYTILRSRWTGLKLVGIIALEVFGIQFFIAQIETLYFNYGLKMPESLILAVVIAGFFLAIAFSFLAVLILGKIKKRSEGEVENRRLQMPRREFVWKFLLLAGIAYPALYILAGHFIAWQFDDVRMLYTGSTYLAPFADQFRSAYLESWLYLYQVLRGSLWILFAIPVIRMLNGNAWEAALVVALLFSCLMSMQLLLPNPFMPGRVPLAHFIETFSSNAVWGMSVVWLLHRHHTSAKDLFAF